MSANFKKYITDLESLIKLGNELHNDLLNKIAKTETKGVTYGDFFGKNYQRWYTEAQALIKIIIPARYDEFNDLYKDHKVKAKAQPFDSYSIQSWLLGQRAVEKYTGEKTFDDIGTVYMKFNTQLGILNSVKVRFESTLMDIRKMTQADLFDDELESAKELNKHGFCRGAGAVAGVVLEKHLSEVVKNHSLKVSKKDPSIADYNDLLKNNNIIEMAPWRFVQHLSDIRNKCDHSKSTEPTNIEVQELIEGVGKICKTLF